MPESRPRRGPPRSRKGCLECRERKIKCDESRPECSQCRKSGRTCSIIDGLFRPHSLSIPVKPESPRAKGKKLNKPPEDTSSPVQANPPANHLSPTAAEAETAQVEPQTEDFHASTTPGRESVLPPIKGLLAQAQSSPSATLHPINLHRTGSIASAAVSSPVVAQDHPTVSSNASASTSLHKSAIPTSIDENHQDRIEVAFFLRHFADLGGQWMDIGTGTGQRSYFSQYIVQLATQSPLLRYSACAMAAKQLGQMRDHTPVTEVTRRSSISASALLQAGTELDFEWYGAKYYEKAILLMARQISHGHSIIENHLSPGEIYRSPGSENNHLDDHETTSSAYRILAACVLCSYEELNATMRAWSSHLDGINKLLRPHLELPLTPENFYRIPQSLRALDASFWYFAINDMLNSLTLSRPCRININETSLWRRMGLPLNDIGQLAVHLITEPTQEEIFFKAIIYLLCRLSVKVSGYENQHHQQQQNQHPHPHQICTDINQDLDQWYNSLPPEFLATIIQPLSHLHDFHEAPETWFGSDTYAVAMSFYHMARILLLINTNQITTDPDTQPNQKPHDLLRAYNALQRSLSHHAGAIVSIAYGMTGIVVQKFMVQPLYIAGRCFSSWEDRRRVVSLLRRIEGSLGLATEYRVRDLSEEWGVGFEEMGMEM